MIAFRKSNGAPTKGLSLDNRIIRLVALGR